MYEDLIMEVNAPCSNACIEDSKKKGKKGLCILCAAKKIPFLADPKFLKYKGFIVCDEADNGIQLWYMPFDIKEKWYSLQGDSHTEQERSTECAYTCNELFTVS